MMQLRHFLHLISREKSPVFADSYVFGAIIRLNFSRDIFLGIRTILTTQERAAPAGELFMTPRIAVGARPTLQPLRRIQIFLAVSTYLSCAVNSDGQLKTHFDGTRSAKRVKNHCPCPSHVRPCNYHTKTRQMQRCTSRSKKRNVRMHILFLFSCFFFFFFIRNSIF